MAEEDKDIKIIPRVNKLPVEPELCCLSWRTKSMLFAAIFCGFLILLISLSFLPLEFPLRILGLIFGSFLLVDLHKTLKVKSHG